MASLAEKIEKTRADFIQTGHRRSLPFRPAAAQAMAEARS
jgi:hypothetical protein